MDGLEKVEGLLTLLGQITTNTAIVGIGECLSRGTLISMFLVMFILPQILLLGDAVVERTRFSVKAPLSPLPRRQLSGSIYLNGRVRGRVNGFVDAEIRGAFHGDLSAVMESGAYQEESQKEEPPHEEHP